MEEEKAAAYYDELTRKGEGAARFKQGLGFSSNSNNPPPSLGSTALPSSNSSFLSNFVKASSNNSSQQNNNNKKDTLESIQNKLKRKPSSSSSRRISSRDRSPSRERDDRDRGERSRRRRSRESSRRRRSRSRERRRGRSRSRSRERRRGGSPRRGRRERERDERGKGKEERVDYAKLIQGYDQMTPAERVKAKMKLQLNDTAKKDVTIGTGAGWERFDFDKDAPLDDEEVEAADDDAALVKHIGKSFRFSNVEARREEQIKAAHDEAMFGAPVLLPSNVADAVAGTESDSEDNIKESNESIPVTNLLSEKVLAKQQGFLAGSCS